MDFLLRNARIVELDGGPGWVGPVDLLVEAGRIRDVDHGLPRPPGIPELDAGGRWVIPGLWDQHTHLAMWTASSGRLDLAGTRSADEALARLRGRLAASPGRPVVGYGHRPITWPVQPTVAALDEVASDVPVVLVSGDAHHGWLNSRALDLLGVAPREGILVEQEWYDVYARIHEVAGDETSPEAYERMERAAAALGVVGVLELEYGEAFDAWPARLAEGVDVLRIRRGVYPDGLDAVIEAGLRTGDPLVEGHDLLTMGPLKIISDGSLNTRTAWCEHAYADGSGHGAPNQTPAELRSLMSRATEHGLRTAVHAIGDAACHDAVAAYAETGARGSIEHAQLMTRADVAEMGRLGRRRERAARAPARRPRRDRADLAGPGRAVLPAALDGRRRRRARPRLRRARVAAGPVARDGSRRAPVGRRTSGLAPRAGAHREGGAGRLRRRARFGARGHARRPRPPRRRPARPGRYARGPGRSSALDARRRHLGRTGASSTATSPSFSHSP